MYVHVCRMCMYYSIELQVHKLCMGIYILNVQPSPVDCVIINYVFISRLLKLFKQPLPPMVNAHLLP